MTDTMVWTPPVRHAPSPIAVDVAVLRAASAGRERLEFHAETRIDRLAFGMNSGYPLVSREVDLKISSAAEAI